MLIIVIIVVLNVCVVLFVLKSQQAQQNNGEKTYVKKPGVENQETKPITQLVYKDNRINIIEDEDDDDDNSRFRFFKQFPTIWGRRYNYPREYPPFYGYYGTIYRPYEDRYHDLKHDPDRHRRHERESQPIYQNTINNYVQPQPVEINRSGVVPNTFQSQNAQSSVIKKQYSNNPIKDFLNSKLHNLREHDEQREQQKPKTVFTKYHPADGQQHTGFVKDIQQGDKNYKVFIPDKGTQEGDVYTTEKTFDVQPSEIKETVEVDNVKVDVNLTPEQSLEENPIVDTTEGKETFTSHFDKPKQIKEVVLKCGKRVKIII